MSAGHGNDLAAARDGACARVVGPDHPQQRSPFQRGCVAAHDCRPGGIEKTDIGRGRRADLENVALVGIEITSDFAAAAGRDGLFCARPSLSGGFAGKGLRPVSRRHRDDGVDAAALRAIAERDIGAEALADEGDACRAFGPKKLNVPGDFIQCLAIGAIAVDQDMVGDTTEAPAAVSAAATSFIWPARPPLPCVTTTPQPFRSFAPAGPGMEKIRPASKAKPRMTFCTSAPEVFVGA